MYDAVSCRDIQACERASFVTWLSKHCSANTNIPCFSNHWTSASFHSSACVIKRQGFSYCIQLYFYWKVQVQHWDSQFRKMLFTRISGKIIWIFEQHKKGSWNTFKIKSWPLKQTYVRVGSGTDVLDYETWNTSKCSVLMSVLETPGLKSKRLFYRFFWTVLYWTNCGAPCFFYLTFLM